MAGSVLQSIAGVGAARFAERAPPTDAP